MFKKYAFKKILGVSKLKHNPLFIFLNNKNNLKEILTKENKRLLKKTKNFYFVNGSFYLISPKELRKNKSFFKGISKPLIINSEKEALDIDTYWDFKIAQKFLRMGY